MKGFANPPWNQIPKVLAKSQTQGASIVLIAPVWKSQPWYSRLQAMLVDLPRLLPRQVGVIAHITSAGRVEHLRKRFRDQQLSTQATELILKSWRTKTNKSYDSLFGRWHRWCTGRGSDPISGPVSEVANFLASLYREGYQYNSVNAYRSAISSVHDKVDVGQTPSSQGY